MFSRIKSFSAFRSLRHKNYRLFFLGQIFSLIGTWVQTVGQSWLVYELTHSSVWLGIIGFLNSIPILFFSLVGGSLADSKSKKQLLVFTQVAAMVQAFLLALFVFTGWITPVIIGVLAFSLGVVNAFDNPVRQSFIVDMVGKENLANAIALNSAMFNAARMIGPAVGGILIGLVGVEWCFLLNGISFIGIIIGLFKMKIPEKIVVQENISFWVSVKNSLQYIRSDTTISVLLFLVMIITVFGWSYSILLPVFADTVLHVGAEGLGGLYTATGIGAFISAISLASLDKKISSRKFIYFGVVLFVISIIAFSFSSQHFFSMICLVGVGMGLVAFFATANTILQKSSPDNLRGRIMGIYSLLFQGFSPIGNLGFGIFADGIGVRFTLASGGTICGLTASLVYFLLRKRK